MREQRQMVDYALVRRSALARFRSGHTTTADLCDAGAYLLSAAEFHGVRSPEPCPICRQEELSLVSWVYGDSLGSASGSARGDEELTRLALSHDEFSVHVVEVCRSCRWNHLVQSYVLGRVPVKRPRARRTTTRTTQA